MLEIKPIEDKALQEQLCNEAGAKYLPDALAYAAYVNTFAVGLCQFGLKENTGYIYNLTPIGKRPEDTEALFIMGRAVMSFMESCGAEYADMEDTDATEERIKFVIGFKRNDEGKFIIPIKGMFEHHCKK
ncbi:MAG: hypothetical protein IJF13_00815 [Clostridia bacterium]|nr:hypothetical protein [Clostridia bacterium]